MKKLQMLASIMFLLAFSIFIASCSDDDEDDGPTEIVLTQAALDAANKELSTDLTGGSFPHGGSGLTGDQTYRDIYGSIANVPADVVPGTIITKKTYLNENGNKTDLLVSFAMVKREAGYDSANGDWEYVMIGYDADNDYSQHPFGMLSKAADRGRLGMCIDCHRNAGGNDFLFVND